MAGGARVLLPAVLAAVLLLFTFAESRPQAGDQRPETFLVRPFSQSDRRQGSEGTTRGSASQQIRPFSQSDGREGSRDSSPVRPFSLPSQRDSESLPVRPFNQYETKGGNSQRVAPSRDGENHGRTHQQTSSSLPVRPFSQLESPQEVSGGRRQAPPPRREQQQDDDPYQSRAHASPLNPRITLQQQTEQAAQRQHHHHQQQPAVDRRKDETPNWSTGNVRLEGAPPRTGDGGGGRVVHPAAASSSSTPLLRDNRRTSTPQEPKVKPGSGRGGGGDTVFRMGEVTPATDGEHLGKKGGEPTAATEEGIVFPGPAGTPSGGKVTPGKFVPQVGSIGPSCAKGSTFCETPDSYPSEYLKTVLQSEADGLREFFGNDLVSNETTLLERFDGVDESPMCQSIEQVVYPKMAQNKEDKWLYVVNQDQYIQGVRVEKCLKPESECPLTKSFPLGYKTTCRQKYIYRRMLALNDDGKTLTDTFRLPSCCSCFVKTISS